MYLIVQNRAHRYRKGRSRIVYIGTTQHGINRLAASAAGKAVDTLAGHGVDNIEVHVFTCRPRQNVKTWRKLERAFLLVFRERYGSVPRFNTQGKRITEVDEFRYFRKSRVDAILDTFE